MTKIKLDSKTKTKKFCTACLYMQFIRLVRMYKYATVSRI